MKNKKKRKTKIFVFLIIFILLIGLIFLFNYLNKPKTQNIKIKTDNIKIIEYETKSLCNHAFNQSCKNLFENVKNVEKINDNEIVIYSLTDCCVKFDILSIIKKDNLIRINLIEKGKEVCKCGVNLQKTNIKLNESIDLNKIKILQFKEYADQNIQIFP